MAVKDEQLIFTLYTRCCVEIKVLNLIYAFLISNPPVIGCYNVLGSWKVAFLILISKVVLPS